MSEVSTTLPELAERSHGLLKYNNDDFSLPTMGVGGCRNQKETIIVEYDRLALLDQAEVDEAG
ncbi:hypothetical protein [Solidesulfovibrio magneticus]|uniref:hypothetical protein n=1 Tax=Solidesulfovibrio magneticus TaxID=184917 RepID=UPI0005B80312|nr:hypothetical protein [Solidesulfovibrio magneticus]